MDQLHNKLPLIKERVRREKMIVKRPVFQYPQIEIQMKYPIMEGTSLVENLNLTNNVRIIKEKEKISEDQRDGSKRNLSESLTIPLGTLLRLGVHVMQDRSLCFAGRVVLGVSIPDNPILEALIIERVVRWYSLCIEFQQNHFYLNQECFMKKEILFLRLLSQKRMLLKYILRDY